MLRVGERLIIFDWLPNKLMVKYSPIVFLINNVIRLLILAFGLTNLIKIGDIKNRSF